MACRRIFQPPKVAFHRLYLPSPVLSTVSSDLSMRTSAQFGLSQCRCMSAEVARVKPAIPEIKDNFYYRLRKKFGFPHFSAAFYRIMGVYLYEKIDTLAVQELFEEFQLEDTFYSWYLVMELHLWIVLSKASQYGKEGSIVKDNIGTVMWEDVRRRMKLIAKGLSVSDQSKTLENLSSEMEFALVLYDEAGLSDDRRLAEALWVRLYRGQTVDPIVLEKVVCYVRQQMRHLDLTPKEKFLLKGEFTWLPLKECRIEKS